MKAWPSAKINGDGLKYLPTLGVSETPANNYDVDVKYKLVDIFGNVGTWAIRFDAQSFKDKGRSFLRKFVFGGANVPWGWDDENDLPGVGELPTDPARLANICFKSFGSMDLNYIYNPCREIH